MTTTTHTPTPCPKCKGTGHDATQRYQSWHGCFAHHNSTVCWSCKGSGTALAEVQQ